jgi:hypothetical protein
MSEKTGSVGKCRKMSGKIGKTPASIPPMDIKEVLKLADDLLFAKTGNHLDDLQETILRGTVQGQRYSKIAEDCQCTEGHVRDVASKLWKILSDVVGEDVSKSNFRATLERWHFSIVSSNFAKDFAQINNINVCGDTLQSIEVPETRSHSEQTPNQTNAKPKVCQDLADAPAVLPFYGRTGELATLEKWIVQQRCRLVALLGISGIGKTALAVQLVDQIKDEFEFVLWKSLRFSPPLETIQTHLIQFLSNRQEIALPALPDARLSRLMEYLRKYSCLVIFDDAHAVFRSGELAGHYQTGCEDYSTLFRIAGELSHKSCLLLLSWEPPREIVAQQSENGPVRSFQLKGLEAAPARQLLSNQGLLEEEHWQQLIDRYRSNPLWLKLVAGMIQDLFAGSVAEFLKYDTLYLGEELKDSLAEQFNRLSDVEKQLMSALAQEAEPVSMSKLLEGVKVPPSEVFSAMQSLGRRSLIEKTQAVFNLQPVVRQYVRFRIL